MWHFDAISWPDFFTTHLEILGFVSVGVEHVSLQLGCVEEALRTACLVASAENKVKNEVMAERCDCTSETCDLLELLHSSVLKHVAAQVGLSGETTVTASNCARMRALWTFDNSFTTFKCCRSQNKAQAFLISYLNINLPLRCARSGGLSVSTVC